MRRGPQSPSLDARKQIVSTHSSMSEKLLVGWVLCARVQIKLSISGLVRGCDSSKGKIRHESAHNQSIHIVPRSVSITGECHKASTNISTSRGLPASQDNKASASIHGEGVVALQADRYPFFWVSKLIVSFRTSGSMSSSMRRARGWLRPKTQAAVSWHSAACRSSSLLC